MIGTCAALGLASHLRRFPGNEIAKCALATKLKALKDEQDALAWPKLVSSLPLWSWEECECLPKTVTRTSTC
jgi:stearoyl-CoA desaturase (Delta-9 desaturase)